ncbi:saccharopine dehydrogenase family protein [Rhodobacter sp. Har01]|uniref:saccharopine dehydrogenase family protein n=1 Tax=Rhodobacter sp. Har01 TaxID=2883999 RepID=UPI001D069F91|nr:saccharopine dehydrogenase family protein [Rhodobacter sp. Har01]MCB6179393.1 saccharopine dehydrogenase family protein [Rhodobacter sp. Har01]
MKRNVLIIGAGGVAQVVAHKAAQHNDRLGDLHIASRTVAKAQAIIDSVQDKGAMKVPGVFVAHAVDAMDTGAVAHLIRHTGCQIVINVGSSFVNMTVLEACIETGAAYMDTAIHEDPAQICETPPWYANHEWKRRERCRAAGVTAVLGIGFDPGVVNAWARVAEGMLDRIDSIDIVDINAGSHGKYFATNFDPEINFREFTGTVWSWQGGAWVPNEMFEVGKDWTLPVVGPQRAYLTGHDEVHSLSARYPQADVRFWMGFGDHYINVFTVLKNLGLLSEQPVRTAEGLEVVPLKVVKAVLPDPASLAPTYTGKTCIADVVRGVKDGRPVELTIYNVADHAEAYAEVGSQGISYTAGVPPVVAALLIADGTWDVGRMVNVEELDPRPFISLLNGMGLPSRIIDGQGDRLLTF